MAGVEAEADALVADVVPQAGDGVEVPGHRMVAARGVLQVHGNVGLEVLQRLAPAVEAGLPVVVVGVAAVHDHRRRVDLRGRVAGVLQDLARRDAHPVVGRRDVDQVRRMHVQRHARRLQHLRVLAGFGLLPALRVAEEELHHIGAVGLGIGQGVVSVDMRTNKHVGPV